VSAQAGSRVHIRYPVNHTPDDETWLAAVASRHNGELADYVMESAPLQRTATFQTSPDAHAFAHELTNSRRWQARIIA
jgi:hypothetical protein